MNKENKLEIVTINNIEFYSSKELKEKAPSYFRGVRSLKNIIEKKNIPEKEYIFASFSKIKNRWKTDYNKKTNIPSRVFPLLSVKWCHKNVPFFKENDLKDELEMAPPILVLNDNEKFKDNQGKIYEIETRGKERTIDSVYFLCKDVSNAFGIKSAKDTVFKSNSFVKTKDYITFNRIVEEDGFQKTTKCLFLTYYGVLRLLYRSNCKKANTFTDWASKTLFTIQMGTKEAKQDLASNMLGISIDQLKSFSKVSVSKIPCVYVFSLGHVKDLRKSMSIDKDIHDDHIVLKYGMTDNLGRRASEHVKEYQENIENAKLRLMFFNYIDKKYINEAEKELKDYLSDNILKFKKYKELAILNPKHKNFLKNHFSYINNNFAGELETINLQFEKEKQNFLHELKYKELEYQKNIEKIQRETERQIERQKSEHEMKCLIYEKNIESIQFKSEIALLKKHNELLEKDKQILELEKQIKK